MARACASALPDQKFLLELRHLPAGAPDPARLEAAVPEGLTYGSAAVITSDWKTTSSSVPPGVIRPGETAGECSIDQIWNPNMTGMPAIIIPVSACQNGTIPVIPTTDFNGHTIKTHV